MALKKIKPNIRKGLRGVLDGAVIGKERGFYGVSRTDTWSLHDYLAEVIANGIQFLREENHGWPSCEEYPNPEDWDAALLDIIMRLKQVSTVPEQHNKIYDEILWGPEDAAPAGLEDLEAWLNRPNTPEQDEYRRRCDEVDNVAQENIEFVMAWLSKWWFALWD